MARRYPTALTDSRRFLLTLLTEEFLRTYMLEFRDFIRRVLTVLPRSI